MSSALTLSEIIEPADQAELADVVRGAHDRETAVYPLGGQTSLDYGLPARREGIGLSTTRLNRIVDYPARDMTVTVEAGATMQSLAEALAQEGQQLALDAPLAGSATIGGVVATNFNGPRRYGMGGVRDSVIGVSAVNGLGASFKAGGRVVKNVAGYDLCKLLTGSLGTLGVITQLTLKLRPLSEAVALVTVALDGEEQTERLLAALIHSQTYPAAIELLSGPAWSEGPLSKIGLEGRYVLAVWLEGTAAEVRWSVDTLRREWSDQGVDQSIALSEEDRDQVIEQLREFPAAGDAPLVLKATLRPSGVTSFIGTVRELDADASIQCHAGNGVVIAKFSEFPSDGLSRSLLGRLKPAAAAADGSIVVLSNPSGAESTRQSVWGGDGPFDLMTSVKFQFDPRNILNPDRFVYTA